MSPNATGAMMLSVSYFFKAWLNFGDSQNELFRLPAPQGCPKCNLFFQIVKWGNWAEKFDI